MCAGSINVMDKQTDKQTDMDGWVDWLMGLQGDRQMGT